MESKNAAFLRQGLVDRYRKMSPAERVNAFIEHSRLMQQLRKAGEIRRTALTGQIGPNPMGSKPIEKKPLGTSGEAGADGENG